MLQPSEIVQERRSPPGDVKEATNLDSPASHTYSRGLRYLFYLGTGPSACGPALPSAAKSPESRGFQGPDSTVLRIDAIAMVSMFRSRSMRHKQAEANGGGQMAVTWLQSVETTQ